MKVYVLYRYYQTGDYFVALEAHLALSQAKFYVENELGPNVNVCWRGAPERGWWYTVVDLDVYGMHEYVIVEETVKKLKGPGN